MKKLTLIFILIACCLSLVALSYATIPHLIRYQGTALDKEKIPLDGPYSITFRIYDAETGGTPLWQETQELVPVTKGTFSVLLGNVAPLDLAFDKDYYLSIQISEDSEMFPRQRISSVPYAFRAEYAENISGIPVSQTPTPNNLIPLDSNGQLPISVIPQGAGTGLDADLLDNRDSSFYLNLNNQTGVLSLQRGGTGASLTNNPGGILYCDTNALAILPDDAKGKFLQSGGQAAPSWQKVDISDIAQVTGILPVKNGGTGSSANANTANGVVVLDSNGKLPVVDGSQLTGRSQLFTSNGTFTAPTGVTKVFITMVAGGGGGRGGNDDGGGGGGGGECTILYPYTVTSAGEYAVVVGAAGTAGADGGYAGGNGGASSFDSLSVSGGAGATTSTGAAGGGSRVPRDASGLTPGGSTFTAGLYGGNGGNAIVHDGGGGGGSYYGIGGVQRTNGTGWGSGGGGGYGASGNHQAGGAGTQGFVLVQW
jgi:hypothetical protein